MTRRKKWRHSIGRRPNRVTVFEREPGGVIYRQIWDPSLRGGRGNFRRSSLGHRDRDRAKAEAAEFHTKLLKGQDEWRSGPITLKRLFALYTVHRTPKKKPSERKADARRVEMWSRFLRPGKDPAKLTRAEWERFTDERRGGAICPHGAHGPHERPDESECPGPKRRAVRDRTVEADLRWLLATLNWASRWQDPNGRYLLAENPARGFHVPREKNPRRPVATRDQYETLRRVSDRVMTELRKGRKKRSKRIPARSPLSELLDLAHGTGRRISAILGLRFGDLHLERTATAPHGAITWPAETDKKGRAWERVPIATSEARAAIDRIIRERSPKDEAVAGVIEGGQRIQVPEGTAYLFPAPGDPEKPVHRHLASAWLHEAVRLADGEARKKSGRFTVPKGWGWHAFRREAATELKGAADKDVMELLGWKDLRSLKQAYQHADPEGMLVALKSRRELREVAGTRREP
jgi:hypothetical protein